MKNLLQKSEKDVYLLQMDGTSGKTGTTKTPYYFCSKNIEAMFFAGVYNENDVVLSLKRQIKKKF